MSAAYDFRDLVIEDFADRIVLLQEQVQELAKRAATAEAARDAYRLVAVQAIHHAHCLHAERVKVTAQLERLRDENRDMRARFILQEEEDGRAA